MNYYSRNSPKKRKGNLPPGFLIPTPSLYSEQPTPRSKLKSQFNLTSRHSAQSQFDAYQKQSEILVLDDDVLYVPNSNQILIQEDDQFSEPDHPQPMFATKTENVGLQFQYIPPSIDQSIEINIQKQQKFHQTQPVSKSQSGQNPSWQKNQKQGKYFFRNYSFGDKEFTTNEQEIERSKKQPLIRQLVNMSTVAKLQSRTRRNRNKLEISQISHNSENGKNLEHRSLKGRVQVEEGWSKIVKNFIKKRSSEKKQEVNIEINSEQQSVPQAHIKNDQQQKKPRSHHSSIHKQDQVFQQHAPRQKPRIVNEELQMNIKQNQQDLPAPYFDEQPQVFVEEYDLAGSPISPTFQATVNMFEQVIQVLPQKLVPKYIAFKKQLERKQYQAQITINRMQETQRMLKLLIETHRKKIYVDKYLLDEEQEIHSEIEQKIVVNRQIIMSLIRKLALY